jgi:lysophospholipase L1-like esterase
MTLARIASRSLASIRGFWLFAGVTIVCLVVAEIVAGIGLRMLGSGPVAPQHRADAPPVWSAGDVDVPFAWHSYVYWRFQPLATDNVVIDERGLRRTWNERSAAPQRVFVFGGSTAWGAGARDDFTIPSLVAKHLARDPELPSEVTNFGQWAYVSTQELIALLLELQRGNVPDVVVFYDGINDAFSTYQNGRAGVPENEAWRRIDFESPGQALLYRVARRSRIVSLIHRIRGATFDHWAPPEPAALAGLAEQTIDVYASNLAFAEALGARFGFDVLSYWQPVIWSKQEMSPYERSISEETIRELPALDAFTREVWAQVGGHARLAANPRFRDLSRALDDAGEESMFWDWTHITEAGNERIAREIGRDVSARLAARSRPPR